MVTGGITRDEAYGAKNELRKAAWSKTRTCLCKAGKLCRKTGPVQRSVTLWLRPSNMAIIRPERSRQTCVRARFFVHVLGVQPNRSVTTFSVRRSPLISCWIASLLAVHHRRIHA